jgi:ADP-heptose:LPS heptosyltransferase
MQRVLFIGPSRIGDAVLSSGVLAWMLEQWPAAQVTIAAGPVAAQLFSAVPRLERLIVLEKRPLGTHWWRCWRQTATRHWTAIADTRRTPIAWLLASRRRFIMGRPRPDQHKVLQASAMVPATGPLAPRLWLGDAHRRAAAEMIPRGVPVVALAPTANWSGKQWPAERFAALADALMGAHGPLRGARVAVFAGPGERERATPLLAAIEPARCIDLAGKLDLLSAAACLQCCELFVGNDSGLMHVAAAAGVRTLGLFGPSREAHYGPWGTLARSVRADLSYEQITGVPGFDASAPGAHMDSLPVEKVLAAACALLERSSATAAPPAAACSHA